MKTYPSVFTGNIESAFGEEGRQWLKDLEKVTAESVKRWQLFDCIPVNNLSFNYVCRAESPLFGPVILKIGVKASEVEHEYRALTRFSSHPICRCYDYNRELQALLLERIEPGRDLYSLKTPELQIEKGSAILRQMEGELLEDDDFPYYSQWLHKSFSINRGKIDPYINRAESFFAEHEDSGLPLSLLHGDFHHQNILKDNDGKWVLIDPKGIIGYKTAECGRFFLNQLEVIEKEQHCTYLRLMAHRFSRALSTTSSMVLKGAYVEFVLSCSWSLEGEISNAERLKIYNRLKEIDELYLPILEDLKGT